MAAKVEIIETGVGEQVLETKLNEFLTNKGLSLTEVYALPYGDNNIVGLLVVYDE